MSISVKTFQKFSSTLFSPYFDTIKLKRIHRRQSQQRIDKYLGPWTICNAEHQKRTYKNTFICIDILNSPRINPFKKLRKHLKNKLFCQNVKLIVYDDL